MNFYFFFISYSVIYAKYNYCYEVPKDMPIRYFDGKEWIFMKPRYNIRTKAPRHINILSSELELAELIKEIIELNSGETASEMSMCVLTTSSRTTTRRITTTKKITTKITTTLKPTTKKLLRPIPSTKTAKTTVKHSLAPCKLKLRPTTTTTIDPRIGYIKMLTTEDWKKCWTILRPTIKTSPATTKRYTSETTKRTTKTTKKATPKTTKRLPSTTTTEIAVTTEETVKLSGIQEDDGTSPGKWSNLMKEFLKFVEAKKCQPPCSTTTTKPLSGYLLAENDRARPETEDLMNILMDGVEVDDGLNEVEDDGLQSQGSVTSKEDYQGQMLNYDLDEGLDANNSKIKSEYEQDFDNSFKISKKDRNIKQEDETARYRKKMAYLKESKSAKLKKDYEISRIIESEAYLNDFKSKNLKDDEILHENELKTYVDVLKEKHANNKRLLEYSKTKADLYTNDATNTGKKQDIIKRFNMIRNLYAQRDTINENIQDNLQDTFNSYELDDIANYITPAKRKHSTEKETQRSNEVFYDRDITVDLESLEKYSREAKKEQESVSEYLQDDINDINEHKEYKNMKNYEDIPIINFK